MSLNCNITIPDCGYIVSDTTNGTINIGKDEQIININGILNFDRSSVSTLTVLGNSYLVGDVTAYSKLNVIGKTTLKDALVVSGPICGLGGIAAISSFSVIGKSTFNGDVTITGKLDASGISYSNIDLNSLNVTGTTTLNLLDVSGNSTFNGTIDVSGNSTFNDVTINGNLNANTINLLSLDVSGNSTFNDVTINGDLQVSSLKFSDLTLDNLNVTGQTTLNLLDVTGISNFTNINVTGLTTLGLTSIGNIPDVETAINMKADISALSSYLTKVEAANTYATITSVTPININGFDLVNYKFLQLNTSTTILGSQWINNVIGIPSTSTFTITLPSAFEIINTTLSGLAPIGSCFHTYLNYELGTGRNDIIIKTNNRYNSLTTIYEGFGYTTPVTDQLKLAVHRSYAPIFEPYTTHFISRIDSMTSMTIFKIQ